MVKVLVANEDSKTATNFCQYLNSNDNSIHSSSVSFGIDALNKYNEINPHVFILSSNFTDMKTTEIIDRLSSTIIEKRTSNIILTLTNLKEQNDFLDVAKIYKFIEISKLNLDLLYDIIKQMNNENKYDDFTDKQLNLLLASMGIIITSPRTRLLIEAIKECYYNPNLACRLNKVMEILSYKHNGYSTEAIQSAFRSVLSTLNNNREKLQEHPLGKMFDPFSNISPGMFLKTITEYLYIKNDQDIDF